MIVIVGFMVLLVAVIIGITGVLTNAGPAHPLTGNSSVLGYHVTGSTGARHTAGRGRDARLELSRSQRESAFLNRDRDLLLEQQRSGADAGPAVASAEPVTHPNRVPLLGHWSHKRQSTGTSNKGRQ